MGRLSEARKSLDNILERENGVTYTILAIIKKTTKNGQTYAIKIDNDPEAYIWSCSTLTSFFDDQFESVDEANEYFASTTVTVVFDEAVSQQGRTYISFEIQD